MNKPLTEKEKVQLSVFRKIRDSQKGEQVRFPDLTGDIEKETITELYREGYFENCSGNPPSDLIVFTLSQKGRDLFKELEARSK